MSEIHDSTKAEFARKNAARKRNGGARRSQRDRRIHPDGAFGNLKSGSAEERKTYYWLSDGRPISG